MRRNPTPFEIIVWRNLSSSRLSGYKFRRQHVLPPFIVDFFCPAKLLAVEIDGETHDVDSDRKRDRQLERAGVTILHLTNREVAANIDGVMRAIGETLNAAEDRWPVHPHPNPSPEGEGL